jgi:uncharacterized protein (TIGR00251 family)
MFQQSSNGYLLNIKVIPKSSRNGIRGWENGELVIRINAVPEKGAVNDELIRFLAKHLNIGKSSIKIVQGDKSRHKKISIKGLKDDFLRQNLTGNNL